MPSALLDFAEVLVQPFLLIDAQGMGKLKNLKMVAAWHAVLLALVLAGGSLNAARSRPGGQVTPQAAGNQGTSVTDLVGIQSPDNEDLFPLAINSVGVIVGAYGGSGKRRGFILRGRDFESVSHPQAAVNITSLVDINDAGYALGFYLDAGYNQIGFIRTPRGELVKLTYPRELKNSSLLGITEAGAVAVAEYEVGLSKRKISLLENGVLREIPEYKKSDAMINSDDFSTFSTNDRCWWRLASGERMELQVPGSEMCKVADISATGEIVGTYAKSGRHFAFRWQKDRAQAVQLATTPGTSATSPQNAAPPSALPSKSGSQGSTAYVRDPPAEPRPEVAAAAPAAAPAPVKRIEGVPMVEGEFKTLRVSQYVLYELSVSGINSAEQVVGGANNRGFIWSAGNAETINYEVDGDKRVSTWVRGISDKGVIAGGFAQSNPGRFGVASRGHFSRASGSSNPEYLKLPHKIGSDDQVNCMASSGAIFGTRTDRDTNTYQFFVFHNGDFRLISPPYKSAALDRPFLRGANSAGVAVGGIAYETFRTREIKAFILNKGVMSTFHFPGANYTVANGINDKGQIVGVADVDGQRYCFVRDAAGKFSTLGLPGSVSNCEATAINNSGIVAGLDVTYGNNRLDTNRRAFIFRPKGAPSAPPVQTASSKPSSTPALSSTRTFEAPPSPLPPAPVRPVAPSPTVSFSLASRTTSRDSIGEARGTFTPVDMNASGSIPMGINSGGEVVGSGGVDMRAFYWREGRFTPISHPGGYTTSAGGIADDGTVVGTYGVHDGTALSTFAFLRGRDATFRAVQLPAGMSGNIQIHCVNSAGYSFATVEVTQRYTVSTISRSVRISPSGIAEEIASAEPILCANAQGWAIGRDFVLRGGVATSIQPVNGSAASLHAINDRGDAVGTYLDERGEQHCLLRSADGALSQVLITNATRCRANGINNHGVIVGTYRLDNQNRGFIWYPASDSRVAGLFSGKSAEQLEREQFQTAESIAEKYPELRRDFGAIRMVFAVGGQPRAALQLAESAIETARRLSQQPNAPDRNELRILLSILLVVKGRALGNTEAAIQAMSEASQLNPTWLTFVGLCSTEFDVYLRAQRFVSLVSCSRAIEMNSNHADAYYYRGGMEMLIALQTPGNSSSDLQRRIQAERDLNRYLQLDPNGKLAKDAREGLQKVQEILQRRQEKQ